MVRWTACWGRANGSSSGGNFCVLVALGGLWAAPAAGGWTTLLLLMAVGFFGASFPMIVAHGRALFPPHLVGRGVTLLNLFGLGAVGLGQVVTGHIHATTAATDPAAPYAAIFAFFAVTLAAGLVIYLFARDRTD